MIEIETIRIQDHDFIGVYVNLPQYPIHFIMSTHTILLQKNFAMSYFNQKEKQVAVILCEDHFGFDKMLMGIVLDCNDTAYAYGVRKGMHIKNAVIQCEEKNCSSL